MKWKQNVLVTILLCFIFLYDALTAWSLCLYENSLRNGWSLLLYCQSGLEVARQHSVGHQWQVCWSDTWFQFLCQCRGHLIIISKCWEFCGFLSFSCVLHLLRYHIMILAYTHALTTGFPFCHAVLMKVLSQELEICAQWIHLWFRLHRANQTYTFPVRLSDDIMPSSVFYATVTPVIIWAVVKKLIVDPIVHEQKERDKVKQRELNKARYFYYSNLKPRKCSKLLD